MISLGLISPVAQASPLDLERARHLILEGKPDKAYILLQPYEFEQAGNSGFDYLLGLAALNSGQADKASLILERVLATDPLHAAARVDLGRAYFMLGDIEHARAEFTRAKALNPPLAAQVVIQQYLAKIDTTGKPQPPRLNGYLEAGSGYNSNINNATDQSRISVPTLLNIPLSLNPANVKIADRYWGLAAGGEGVYPVSATWSLYAGADIHNRHDLQYKDCSYSGRL